MGRVETHRWLESRDSAIQRDRLLPAPALLHCEVLEPGKPRIGRTPAVRLARGSSGHRPLCARRQDSHHTPPNRHPGAPPPGRCCWLASMQYSRSCLPCVAPRCAPSLSSLIPRPRAILAHLGEATAPPRIAPARGPPLWDLPNVGTGDFDPHAQPAPEDEFDQRIAW